MSHRKDCPLRHINGNCLPVGGFCTAVKSEICNAVQQAYEHGMRDAIKHPDCAAAEHDATGCLGYGHGKYDDEPIKDCMACEKYTGNRVNLDDY